MVNDNQNPLTPLHHVRLSSEDKEKMWNNIIELMEQSPPDEPQQEKKKRNRWNHQGIKSVMAGVAAVLIVCGFLYSTTSQHWFRGSTEGTRQPANASNTTSPNTPSQTAPSPDNIQMVSSMNGWGVVNHHEIAYTHDGKQHWRFVTPAGLKSGMNAKIAAVNAQVAEVAAYTFGSYQSFVVYRTTNAGQNWKQQTIQPVSGYAYPLAIDFVNEQDGWLLVQTKQTERTSKGQTEVVTLYATHDGGQTWHPISKTGTNGLPTTEQVSKVRFVTPKIGWTATLGFSYVNAHIGKAWVYETTDGGVTWHQIDLPIPSSLKKDYINTSVPVFTSPTNGTCTITYTDNPEIGTNQTMVFQTTDGGKHWLKKLS